MVRWSFGGKSGRGSSLRSVVRLVDQLVVWWVVMLVWLSGVFGPVGGRVGGWHKVGWWSGQYSVCGPVGGAIGGPVALSGLVSGWRNPLPIQCPVCFDHLDISCQSVLVFCCKFCDSQRSFLAQVVGVRANPHTSILVFTAFLSLAFSISEARRGVFPMVSRDVAKAFKPVEIINSLQDHEASGFESIQHYSGGLSKLAIALVLPLWPP